MKCSTAMIRCALIHKTAFCNTALVSAFAEAQPKTKPISSLTKKSTLCPSLELKCCCSTLLLRPAFDFHLLCHLFSLCSRQPQPSQSRSRYRPGAGHERQSARNSYGRGSHCVWELKARTGERLGFAWKNLQRPSLSPYRFLLSLSPHIQVFQRHRRTSEGKSWAFTAVVSLTAYILRWAIVSLSSLGYSLRAEQ